MNSQVISLVQALKSKKTFLVIAVAIPAALYLKAGFVSVAALWFSVVCFYNQGTGQRPWKKNYPLLFLVALFAMHVIWSLFELDAITTGELLSRRVHMLLIPLGFFIVAHTVTDEDVAVILAVFVGGCLLSSFVCLTSAVYNSIRFGSFSGGALPYYSYLQLTAPVNIPPLYFALFCNFALVVILYSAVIKNVWLQSILGCYLACFIVLLSSSIGVFTLFLLLSAWVFKKSLKAGLLLTTAVMLILLSVASNDFLNLRQRLHSSMQVDQKEFAQETVTTISSRLAIWSSAIETIKENPWFGYGVVNGQKALEKTYEKNDFLWGANASLNPHNEFLSALLYFGLPGIGILAAIFIVPLSQAIRGKNSVLFWFLVITLLFFSVESVLERQKGVVFFSFFYALLIKRGNSTTTIAE